MRALLLCGFSAALVGCVSPAAAPSVETGGPKVERLVFVVTTPGRTELDLRFLAEPNVWHMRPVYDFLVNVDAKTGKLVPGLASEWKLEPNGESFRIKLRDAQFHPSRTSGQAWGPVRAEDVKFGWEQLTLPDSLHGQMPYFRDNVKSIEIVNDKELIFHMKGRDGILITALSEYQGGLEVRSKANFDASGPPTYQTGPLAGSGPFMVKEVAESQYLRLQRANNNHWSGTPEFPEFEWRYAKEASTRLAALLTGEAHLADLPQDLLKQAEQQGMKVLRGQFPGTRVYVTLRGVAFKDAKDPSQGYHHPDTPLLDRRVRQALNKAINREEMNKAFFGGKGETMYLNHFHPTRSGWNPEWEKKFQDAYGYDPAKARALLAEAGQTNLRTTMIVYPLPGVPGGEDLAEAVASYWRQVGINVQLQTMEVPEINRIGRAFGFNNHLAMAATGSNQWSGQSIWGSTVTHLGNGFESPKIDAVLRQIATETDSNKQETLWRQLGDTAFDEFQYVNLFWLPTEAVGNPKIVGEWMYPGGITGSWTHVVNIRAAR